MDRGEQVVAWSRRVGELQGEAEAREAGGDLRGAVAVWGEVCGW